MAVSASTAVGPLPEIRSAALSVAAQSMSVTFNGEADAIYDVSIVVVEATGSGDANLYLRMNGLTTNLVGNFVLGTGADAVVAAHSTTELFIVTARSGREAHVNGTLICPTGRLRSFTGIGVTADASDLVSVFSVGGMWDVTTPAMTSLTVYSSVAASVGPGSYISLRPRFR